jgi:MFS transporter, ACS family, solute carrier family 17 (sodium-dependent inorganic phosphate cotransporter), other
VKIVHFLKGYILSSFFYGYIVTQLPAAFLSNYSETKIVKKLKIKLDFFIKKATKYGGRWFFGAGIGFCSFLSLLMPAATYLGPGFLIALRILQGLTQGSN